MPLILFVILILVDALVALTLMGVIAGSFRGGIANGTAPVGMAMLLLAAACMAGALAAARRKRMGLAIGLAAVPAVLAALLMAGVAYLLSHMGPHH